MRYFKFLVLLPLIFVSCSNSKDVLIWTDHPEFALYGEYFNAVQSQYRVSVRYIRFPSAELSRTDRENIPDLIVTSWLKNASTEANFRSLETVFGKNKLSKDIFYPRLLDIGRIEKNQLLLPVSFNIPALIFSREREPGLSNQFTIDFEEIKNLSSAYNIQSRGTYTRMGFSPLWNDNFLFITAVLSGASFREANPLAWDSAALERSMVLINNWTDEINSNTQADEDFTYKYFFEPPERLIQSGRILFSYMESSDLFILSEDRKNNLDFRWIMEQNRIPVIEDSVYMGIPKKAKAQRAAMAFIQWFYQPDTQRQLLEYSRMYRINENSFGICGGFSALTSVTEQIYPLFYPELLGRMPPSDNFSLPNILPGRWAEIKERVVLPYLHARARSESTANVVSLERRLLDWIRLNQ